MAIQFGVKKLTPNYVVTCGLVELLRHKVFYGHIMQQIGKVFHEPDHSPVPTMGVGRGSGEMLVKLYVNNRFVQQLIDTSGEKVWDHVGGVLEHEVLHLVFGHLNLDFSDKQRGQVAVDLVVNSCIERERLPGQPCIPEDYKFPCHQSAMWYYVNLRDNPKYIEQCKSGVFGIEGIMSDAVDSHELWEHCKDDPMLGEVIKSLVRNAKKLCGRDYGNIPSEVVTQIDELLKTKKSVVPWQRVLRLFCASSTESRLDYTMKRRSKRFGTRPGTKKGDVLNLAVAVDTSGSISDEKLALFFNEIRWVWRNGSRVTIYEADAAIQHVYQFRGKFTGKVHGRGGTNLEPVLQEVVTHHFDALIYFTDFYAPSIEKRYNIPILWVLTTELEKEQFPYKWGRFIKIEGEKSRML